jgi:hypothetical protein
LYAHLSAREYLVMVGELRGLPSKPTVERIEGLLQLLGLALRDVRYVPLSAYSKGMRQKVLLVAALLHDPQLLLLDEPFSGLDVPAGLFRPDSGACRPRQGDRLRSRAATASACHRTSGSCPAGGWARTTRSSGCAL